ncbi:hypothetical protein GCM10010361_17890 [Streptomyces olivaceiscleroticus]|uniref:Uncharacterized protein n=1 Tax=Streptomyces olivaceiscleroticus TaxID=68245 RepID=A0ABP3JHZ6_9ACTN
MHNDANAFDEDKVEPILSSDKLAYEPARRGHEPGTHHTPGLGREGSPSAANEITGPLVHLYDHPDRPLLEAGHAAGRAP